MTHSQNSVEPAHRVNQILEDITRSTKSWQDGNDRSRQDTISACFQMIQELETPSETVVRLTWEQPSQLAAVVTALDLNLFKQINTETAAKSTDDLAKKAEVDPALMTRILRVMSSIGIVHETSNGDFMSAPMSRALEDPDFASMVKFVTDFVFPVNLKTPAYLREQNYQNPMNIMDTPMQFVHGSKYELNMFQLLGKFGWVQGFEDMMKAWTKDLKHWSDEQAGFYPLQKRLIEGARKGSDEVFMVDIGGGQGTDILKVLAHHGHEAIPGRLVLQDLPQLIGALPQGHLPNHVEAIGYDFFTPQPIKGARFYFLHSILHGQIDERSKLILKNVTDVMEPGYSKLLICDLVLPDKHVPPFVAALDWEMMTYVAGHERTEKEWRNLLEDPEVGLKITGIWHYSQYNQSVIELELA